MPKINTPIPQWIRYDGQDLSHQSPLVAAIGNFDGVHVGHQRIIARVVEKATACGGIPTIITFYPLPYRRLHPEKPFFQLMSLSEKLILLGALGIQRVVGLRFNAALRRMAAERFVHEILAKQLRISALVVGEDFRFGHQQQGDIAGLKQWGSGLGLDCETISVQGPDKISSTAIRHALQEGKLAEAERLLGRPYAMTGRVTHGRQQGRLLGSPTANIRVPAHRQGLQGTFIVRANWRGQSYPAVANIGTRPTVGGRDTLLEVHLLDFAADLYGERLTIEFIEKIRDEKRFESVSQLREQIHQDIAQGRAYFETALVEG